MNPHTATIAQLQTALRDRTLSATELLELHIGRIEEVNPLVNGLVADRFETARNEARIADECFRSTPDDAKPLTGIPCTVKEFIGVESMPQSGGVLWRQDERARSDATVVSRLKNAGAIIMGVTNIPEGGLWLETYNAIYGRTKNPWNLKRTSGGSSGGEGVLVATGASPFGIGSDVGGSIRIPAAFCGTVGHKPTGGLVPNTGHYPENALTTEGGRYLTIGPLTRSVDDAWIILQTISGTDGIDPSMKEYQLGSPDTLDVRDLKVIPIRQNGRTRVRGDVGAAIEQSTEVLREAGAQILDTEFPNLRKSFEIWSAMLTAGTAVPYGKILGENKKYKNLPIVSNAYYWK